MKALTSFLVKIFGRRVQAKRPYAVAVTIACLLALSNACNREPAPWEDIETPEIMLREAKGGTQGVNRTYSSPCPASMRLSSEFIERVVHRISAHHEIPFDGLMTDVHSGDLCIEVGSDGVTRAQCQSCNAGMPLIYTEVTETR
jgi:hypothetical protein